MKASRFTSSCFAIICLGTSAAYAARDFDRPEDATHVVTGWVRAVYSYESEFNHHYMVEIVIDKVEKGNSLSSGDAIEVSCYQPKPKTGRETADQLRQRSFAVDGGHNKVPAEGDQVRVFAKRFQGIYQGLFPDWVDVIKPAPPKPQVVSAASNRSAATPWPAWSWATGGLVAGLCGGFCVARLLRSGSSKARR